MQIIIRQETFSCCHWCYNLSSQWPALIVPPFVSDQIYTQAQIPWIKVIAYGWCLRQLSIVLFCTAWDGSLLWKGLPKVILYISKKLSCWRVITSAHYMRASPQYLNFIGTRQQPEALIQGRFVLFTVTLNQCPNHQIAGILGAAAEESWSDPAQSLWQRWIHFIH